MSWEDHVNESSSRVNQKLEKLYVDFEIGLLINLHFALNLWACIKCTICVNIICIKGRLPVFTVTQVQLNFEF